MRRILIIAALAILVAVLIPAFLLPASATGPTYSSAVYYGGGGDQRGAAIVISGSDLYVAGTDTGEGLVVKYGLPPTTPVWSMNGAVNTNYEGLALSSTTVYGAGSAHPPSCGASDGVGGTEGKTSFARYTTAGVGLGCQSTNHFPYRGGEGINSATTTVEGGNTFFYTTGTSENCGFGHHVFVLSKHDAAGALINKVTEPGVSFTGFNCVGGSQAIGLHEYNGALYVAGTSNLNGLGEDGGPGTDLTRPVLMKYDTSLSRVWKQRPSDYPAGHFYDVTSAGGALYAVGSAYTPNTANSRDYLIEKYDEGGVRQWSKISGGASDDELRGVVGIGGRLYAVGYTRSSGAGGADAVILEIDPATGNTVSTTLHGGAQDDFANDAATDGIDLYVVGESRSFASAEGNLVGHNDLMLLRYTDTTSPCDDVMQLSTKNTSVAENGGPAVVSVSRTGSDCTSPIAVNYGTGSNTTTSGDDYTPVTGRLVFEPGETTKTFNVQIVNDIEIEGHESINLFLSSPAGGVLGQNRTGVVTIADNDSAGVFDFALESYAVGEGFTDVKIKVTRTVGRTGTVSVNVSTSDNTATNGPDYTGVSTTLTFGHNVINKSITVSILEDQELEGAESLNLTLSNPTGGAVLGPRRRAVLFINDNEVN